MKKLMLLALAAIATAATTQAAEQPSVLRKVAKKQTLTASQMQEVRGEGLLTAVVGAKVKLDASVQAKVVVPCLLNVDASVKVHANVHAGAIVKL